MAFVEFAQLLASLGQLVPEWVRERRAAGIAEREDTIEAYIEWLHRQRHQEVIDLLEASGDEARAAFDDMKDWSSERFAELLVSIENLSSKLPNLPSGDEIVARQYMQGIDRDREQLIGDLWHEASQELLNAPRWDISCWPATRADASAILGGRPNLMQLMQIARVQRAPGSFYPPMVASARGHALGICRKGYTPWAITNHGLFLLCPAIHVGSAEFQSHCTYSDGHTDPPVKKGKWIHFPASLGEIVSGVKIVQSIIRASEIDDWHLRIRAANLRGIVLASPDGELMENVSPASVSAETTFDRAVSRNASDNEGFAIAAAATTSFLRLFLPYVTSNDARQIIGRFWA